MLQNTILNNRKIKQLESILKKDLVKIIFSKIIINIIENSFTITKIIVSKDLKNANVCIMTSQDNNKQLIDHLNHNSKKIKMELAKLKSYKHIPKIRFQNDKIEEKIIKMQKSLSEI